INVFDPSTNVIALAQASYTVTNYQAVVPGTGAFSVVYDGLVVKDSAGVTTYTLNTDYTLGYDVNGNMIVTLLSTGAGYAQTALKINGNTANPSAALTASNVIGAVSGSGIPS